MGVTICNTTYKITKSKQQDSYFLASMNGLSNVQMFEDLSIDVNPPDFFLDILNYDPLNIYMGPYSFPETKTIDDLWILINIFQEIESFGSYKYYLRDKKLKYINII